MHTKQTAFNQMWNFFITQDNPPCIIGDGAYYRYKRTRCIIGCCMSLDDSKALPGNDTIARLFKTRNRTILKNFSYKDREFYIEAQAYHDSFDWTIHKDWKQFIKSKLELLAKKHNLVVPGKVSLV